MGPRRFQHPVAVDATPSRVARHASRLVAGCAFALFAFTASPTITFGDGPELIAAADCLGVAHPPGYPLYTILGWLALRLPIGEAAFRMNLLSAAAAALACGAVSHLLFRLSSSLPGAVTGGALLAVSSTFWSAATGAEVYALHMLLVALLLVLAAAAGTAEDDRGRTRALGSGAVVLGFGLAHHPTILLAVPAAMCLALAPRASTGVSGGSRGVRPWLKLAGWRWAFAAATTVAIPVLFYSSLMLRARRSPPSNWGRVVDLPALAAHAQALAFRHHDLGWANLLRAEPWQRFAELLVRDISVVALPVAFLGLAGGRWLGLRAAPRRYRVGLSALMTVALAFGLRYDVTDVDVFYLPVYLGLACAAGLGIAALAEHRRRGIRPLAISLGVLLVAFTAVQNGPHRNLRGSTAARDYARDILASVPQGGVLFVETMDSFGVLYLTQVLGERPDVTIYDRSGLVFKDLVDDAQFSDRERETLRADRILAEQRFIDSELARPNPRAILFVGWPGYDVPARYRLEPTGLLQRVRLASDPIADTTSLWSGYHVASVTEQARRLEDGVALGFAATYPLSRGEQALFEGRPAEAAAAFDEARRLGSEMAGIHSYIGTVYARYGDYRRAIDAFRRAVEIRPSSYNAWNNLARAYWISGDKESARSTWRRSLEVAPGQAEVFEALRRLDEPVRPNR